MNGAECLLETAARGGVEVCFANPGTTEMPLVAALDRTPGIRAILGLFEGVCTGAADGYGRMTRRPALTLLHLGPGFANGIANLHNASRAHSPIVNLIGDQASWHLAADAPLTSDIESLARPVSIWVRATTSAKRLARDGAEAIRAASSTPGGVATLIVPADFQWEEAGAPVEVAPPAPPGSVPTERIESVAERIREASACVLLVGGSGLGARGQRAAGRIAAAHSGRIFAETFPARWERGGGLPLVERLPYFPEQALEVLKDADVVVTAGARHPVAFFGYPGVPSELARTEQLASLAEPSEDVEAALESLADALDAPAVVNSEAQPMPETAHSGPLDPGAVGAILAGALPEGAVVVDEAATSGLPFYVHSAGAAPHTLLCLTGGAIGQGLPCATGAAIACPDRKVIAFQADGSGLYTVQSLWTQAREGLDVVNLICSNRAYRILQVELARSGVAEPGPQARALTSLAQPEIDWVALARGFGVPGQRVETAQQLSEALPAAIAESGPSLIEMML